MNTGQGVPYPKVTNNSILKTYWQ